MSPLAPAGWRTTEFIIRRGTRANQPDADTVTIGTLYFVTDELTLERSDGTNWDNCCQVVPNPNGGGFVTIGNETALKYTFMPTGTGGMEIHVATDANFAATDSIDVSGGVAFQGYNDAVNANVPFEFRGTPIVLTVGAVVLNQTLSPAALAAGNNNNYNPTSLDTTQILRLSGDGGGGSVLTGLVPEISSVAYRRLLIIINVSANTFTITNEDGASTAANRFLNRGAATVTMTANNTVMYWYDTATSRWRQIS